MCKTHDIKILEEYADAVYDEKKTFEIRKDDRDYQVGDILRFAVINDKLQPLYHHPLWMKSYEITYVLRDFGLEPGYVAIGIKATKKHEEKITVPLNNGYQLVAERNTDPSFDKEIFIGVTDGNGVWWQDLAVVRNAYKIYSDSEVDWKDGEFDILVYSDKNNEDFTHDFTVGLYHGSV